MRIKYTRPVAVSTRCSRGSPRLSGQIPRVLKENTSKLSESPQQFSCVCVLLTAVNRRLLLPAVGSVLAENVDAVGPAVGACLRDGLDALKQLVVVLVDAALAAAEERQLSGKRERAAVPRAYAEGGAGTRHARGRGSDTHASLTGSAAALRCPSQTWPSS